MPTLTNRTYRTKKEKNDTKDRGYIKPKKYAKYYNSKQWKDLRAYKISQSPLCEICLLEGRSVPATEVHHTLVFGKLKTQDEKWEALLNYDLLASLCSYHHHLAHKYLNQYNKDYLDLETIVELEKKENEKE